MDDLISRKGLLEAYDNAHKGPPGNARRLIEEAPAVISDYDDVGDFDLSFAVEALKRAEKKKPILKDHAHNEYFSASVECGNCGAVLGGWNYGRVFCTGSKEWFIEQNLFCRRCGQAFDWSDV